MRRGERVDHYDTVRRRKDGSLIDISLTVSPLKNTDGRIVGGYSKIARDITERKRAQEQQKLLVKEMKHRIKNSLATVQAIATQTLNRHAEERDAFIARLHALDNAHDLLTSETWQTAPLHSIVTQALKPFQEQPRAYCGRRSHRCVVGCDQVGRGCDGGTACDQCPQIRRLVERQRTHDSHVGPTLAT